MEVQAPQPHLRTSPAGQIHSPIDHLLRKFSVEESEVGFGTKRSRPCAVLTSCEPALGSVLVIPLIFQGLSQRHGSE